MSGAEILISGPAAAAAETLVKGDRDLPGEFKAADIGCFPALAELDERQQMFWVLRVGVEQLGLVTMTPGEISAVLRDAYAIDLSRQRIEATLSGEGGTVAKRRRSGRRAYQLMAKGSAELERASDGATFIDPDRGYSGLREVHDLLGGVEGDLRVCDPYVELRTLDMLAECEHADSIRLLTRNVKRPAGFKQGLRAFEREQGVRVEVRRAPDGMLHDRYLIHDGGMLMFGTSLNGLGLKQSLVVALGQDVRAATLGVFESTWDDSEDFWP